MYPYPFSYHRPSTVAEALALIAEFGDDGKVLAGGQSLLPVMKLRLAQPGHLVDIGGLTDLQHIREVDGAIEIGALATHHDLLTSPILQSKLGLLPEIANVVGDLQVRNRGTIGGTLAHSDPAADYPAGVLALNATILATGLEGSREIAANDFFTGFLETALAPGELITAICISPLDSNTGFSYQKLANPASGYAIVGVAAVVGIDASGTISTAGIGITGASDKAWRATEVEAALVGTIADAASIREASKAAVSDQDMLSDIHAPAEYRARVTRNLVSRAVQTAIERATS